MAASRGKIGFIGIGAMGTPMAANLVKAGLTLVVYDIDMKRTSDFASRHKVEFAAILADVGLEFATVITVLPYIKAVLKSLFCEV